MIDVTHAVPEDLVKARFYSHQPSRLPIARGQRRLWNIPIT